MNKPDRRDNTRVHFHTTATLTFAEDAFKNCETRDLSVKGVFVLGVTDKEEGDECTVDLHLSGSTSNLTLQMQGEVVRRETEGVAVNFHEIDLDSYYHLKNIVYYNAENPESVAEDFFDDLPDDDFEEDFE